jgi:hypothetical protein
MSLTQPDLRPINTKEWKLWEDWIYEWEESGLKCRTIIKAGQITDMASIPKVLWWIGPFQPDGLHRAAADWHDRAYSTRGHFYPEDPAGPYEEFDAHFNVWLPKQRVFTREECDRMFLKIMLEAGESASTANTMFWAVRLFGRFAW